MSRKQFGMATAIATTAIATVVVPFSTAKAINPHRLVQGSEHPVIRLAQVTQGDTGCRQTNATVGVYADAVEGTSPIALIESDTPVKLAITGNQTDLGGWVYITQPTTGWVRARFLTDCSAEAEEAFSPVVRRSPQPVSSQPILTQPLVTQPGTISASPTNTPIRTTIPRTGSQMNGSQMNGSQMNGSQMNGSQTSGARITEPPAQALNPANPAPSPALVQTSPPVVPSSPPAVPPASSTQAAVPTIACDVLLPDGLTVRTQPSLQRDTYWLTLPPGTHAFRFTRNTVTENGRRWVYITSPSEGWVLLNQPDGSATIGGDRCG
jgi:hypothetical protein